MDKIELNIQQKKILVIFALISIAFAVTAQFLRLDALPISPVNDLARHVAMAENFFTALRAGQFWPVIQMPAFADIPDVPLFQYYGFMTGVVALPGLLLSLSSLKALMLGVFFFRIIGAAGVYWAGNLLGGNRKVSLLAALVYYMTPYVISNLYGRVAVPEALAHCEIPFLIIGILLGLRGRLSASAVVIALTVLLLSLTHPIFLLYGCMALVVMMVVSLSPRVIVSGSVGLFAGVLISTFRWYPMLMSHGYFTRFPGVVSPTVTAELTSGHGLWGLPISLSVLSHMKYPETDFLYLTPSWFTIPVLLGLIVLLLARGKLSEKLCILIPSILFLCLAFAIGDIYKFLPNITWLVQFPYRLLSFVGLFTALSLPLLFPRLNVIGFIVLALMAILQSAALIFHLSYHEPLQVPRENIARLYANYDYAIGDKYAITEGDNWMFYYARRFYPIYIADGLSQPLKSDYEIPEIFSAAKQQFVRIEGIATSNHPAIQVWLEDPYHPKLKSNVQQIAPGAFSITFTLPVPNKAYRLVTSPALSPIETNETTVMRVKMIEGWPYHFLNFSWQKPAELRLSGKSIFTDRSIELWLAKPANPMVPVTGKVTVGPGEFNVKLPYPNDANDYIIVPSEFRVPAEVNSASSDQRRLSLEISNAEVVPVDAPVLPRITYGYVDTIKSHGYSRLYSIQKNAWWTPNGITSSPGTVELPLAYSPFYMITQNGRKLTASPDDKGRTNVLTNDLTANITASYRLPIVCYLALMAGLAVLFGFIVVCIRMRIDERITNRFLQN